MLCMIHKILVLLKTTRILKHVGKSIIDFYLFQKIINLFHKIQ